MEIKEAQRLVKEHLDKINYKSIETEPAHAFMHLIEETGELSRCLLHKITNRNSIKNPNRCDLEGISMNRKLPQRRNTAEVPTHHCRTMLTSEPGEELGTVIPRVNHKA